MVVFFIVFSVGITESKATALETKTTLPLAPGYGKLGYEISEVGSYSLPALGNIPDGMVLDDQGNSLSLHDLYKGKYSKGNKSKGKYTLLSFIYSNCKDVNGCPLASYVFYKLKTKMRKDPELADTLRLASLSFDPERDTPEIMRLYGANYKYAGNKGEWHFLTTPSVDALNPILKSYNQDIQREMSVNGEQTEDISHILRVFLIDPKLQIRNVYSVGFLHADIIESDMKTLLAEDDFLKLSQSSEEASSTNNMTTEKTRSTLSKQRLLKPKLSKPGDVKDGYEKKSYTTNSKSISNRKGKPADLLSIAMNPPLGLPKTPVSPNNPLTTEKIELGRKLFYDRRLSLNDTFSCAMCHVPEQGFTSNEISMAVGIEGRSVRRNSPTIYNVAYASRLFHDGRDSSLEEQIWSPLLAKNEMANPSVGHVIGKIRKMPDYKGLFEKAFKGEGVNMRTVSQAFASYERTLISADSEFDRWYFKKQANALSEDAQRGFSLFSGKARCVSCHSINKEYALFTDNKMHNTGIGYNESMGIRPATERVILAPGIFVEVDTKIIDSVGEKIPADTGLYEITQNPHDRWKYKTPSLRNISLTAPYMHNGSLLTLESVVRFYNKGGVDNKLQDLLIKPLGLSEQEVSEIVSFLESLTGSNVDVLVADAFDAPIGDLTPADPNWAHDE